MLYCTCTGQQPRGPAEAGRARAGPSKSPHSCPAGAPSRQPRADPVCRCPKDAGDACGTVPQDQYRHYAALMPCRHYALPNCAGRCESSAHLLHLLSLCSSASLKVLPKSGTALLSSFEAFSLCSCADAFSASLSLAPDPMLTVAVTVC